MEIYIKNWAVRKLENSNELKLIIYDFGLVIESEDLEHNRNLWSAAEDNDKEGYLM